MATQENKPRAQAAQKPSKDQSGAQPSRSLSPGRESTGLSRRWDPFTGLRHELNRLFDRWFPEWPGFGEMARDGWSLDVQENDNTVTLRAEAPGFEPSEFDIQVRGDQLILKAAHKAETEEKDSGLRQWSRQEFYRSVSLPPGVDSDKIEAGYRNGVLTLTMPKTAEAKAKRIEVKH